MLEDKEQVGLALRASRLVLWDYDVATGMVNLTGTWSVLLGGESVPTTVSIAVLNAMVPEADRGRLTDAIGAAMKGPASDYSVEHRVIKPNGDTIWIASEGRVVARDPGGRALRLIGTNQDISARIGAAEALRQSEARFRSLTELFSDWYWELDTELRFTRIEGAGLARIGVRAADVLGSTAQAFPRYEMISMTPQAFARIRAEHKRYRDVRGRFSMPDGGYFYVAVTGEPVFGEDGRFCGYRGVTRDITDQTRAEAALAESEARFKGALENSPIGIALVGLDGRFLTVNRALATIVGYEPAELQALTFQEITHPDDLETDLELLREVLAGTRDTYTMEKRYLHKGGHEIRIQLDVSLSRDNAGKPLYFISQIMDVSERHRMQERIKHLALHDPLTGLPNARLLEDRLDRAIATAKRAKRPMGVLYMDLDGFKPVNDTHGHAAGDLVLKEFAARLVRVLRATDSVARVGGDEFVAVLGELPVESDAVRAAERVLAAVIPPFDIGANSVTLSASIGIALYPAHGEDGQTLLQCADSAMYLAKHGGKNAYRVHAGSTD